MLETLHIRDLALIEHAEVRFCSGLNVVSGETGSGKSLLVTALKLLRGERASSSLVRHGADELRVDGEFVLGEGGRAGEVAAEVRALIDAEVAGTVLVTRIVDASGRSKVRINGRPATLTALRALGPLLLEIHGQDESRALMRPEIQAETLDAFAGSTAARHAFAEALAAARTARDRLEAAADSERDRSARMEFLRYQLREIDELALQPGEVAQLEQEHRLLAHLDHLRELLSTALSELTDDDAGVSDRLARAQRALAEAAQIDPELGDAASAAAEAELLIAEAGRAVQSGLGRLDLDPERLAHVEERLDTIRRALARFGPREEDFLRNAEELRAELAAAEDGGDSVAALTDAVAEATAELERRGRKLQRARAKAAPRLCAAVRKELEDLAMQQAEVRVAFDDAPARDDLVERATAHGPAPLDLEVRINPGEPFQSMRETASGGEMARIVLAVKKCLADQDRVPFLAFDEIDAEIGGRLGLAVGHKLREVARHHQVLIVTHLPQVAAFAEAHLVVRKKHTGGRTRATVTRLDARAVERELAAMAVGEGADADALREARRLVDVARERGAGA